MHQYIFLKNKLQPHSFSQWKAHSQAYANTWNCTETHEPTRIYVGTQKQVHKSTQIHTAAHKNWQKYTHTQRHAQGLIKADTYWDT